MALCISFAVGLLGCVLAGRMPDPDDTPNVVCAIPRAGHYVIVATPTYTSLVVGTLRSLESILLCRVVRSQLFVLSCPTKGASEREHLLKGRYFTAQPQDVCKAHCCAV